MVGASAFALDWIEWQCPVCSREAVSGPSRRARMALAENLNEYSYSAAPRCPTVGGHLARYARSQDRNWNNARQQCGCRDWREREPTQTMIML